MGCSNSVNQQSVRVSPAKKSEIRISESVSRSTFLSANLIDQHPCDSMYSSFKTIMNGIQRIPRPHELDFIACLTGTSFPLVTYSICIEDKENSHMVLPVIAVSIHGKGRVIAFGNFEILTECKQENAEYFSFLENVLGYAAGHRPPSSTVYFLNVGHQDTFLLSHNLSGLGYHIESGNNADKLSKYAVIVTYSMTRFENELYEYIVNGGGVIVGSSFDWLPSIASMGPIEDPLPSQRRKLSASAKNTSSTSSVSSPTSSAASVNSGSSVFKTEKQLQSLLSESHQANHLGNCWLSRCGLGFPDVHASLPIVQKAAIKVCSKIYDLEKSSFPCYVNDYIHLMQEEKPSISDLSTIISYLRYNILCNNRSPNMYITQVFDLSMEYLQITNFEQPEGIFYSESHFLMAILLTDIIDHIDPHDFISRKCDMLFPGEYEPESNELEVVHMDIQIQHLTEWASTGLYLPAGQVATVTINPLRSVDDLNSFYEDLFIQIGSHSESLLSSPGPWKRWPKVVLKFPVKQGEIEIASPFGGLIYVVREPIPTIQTDIQQVFNQSLGCRNNSSRSQTSTNKTLSQSNNATSRLSMKNMNEYKYLSLDINNVVRCPFYADSEHNPHSLVTSTAPWGEICTKHAIITLPSIELYKIQNLNVFSTTFDKMIKQIELFVGFSTTRRFRLVFDVDQPKIGTTSSYPLMLSFELFNSLFNIEKASSDLFAVMMMIGIICLPENVLNPNIEAAFGMLAAAHVFYVTYNITSPSEFIYEHISPIFAELWKVYSRNDIKLIPTAMAKFQTRCKMDQFISNEEAFTFLVNELSAAAEKDFSSLLNEGLRPPETGHQYPEYHPVEEYQE